MSLLHVLKQINSPPSHWALFGPGIRFYPNVQKGPTIIRQHYRPETLQSFCWWFVCSVYCISTMHRTDQSSHPVSDFSRAFGSIAIVTGIAADRAGAFEASVWARIAVEMIAPLKHFTSHFYALISAIMASSGECARKWVQVIKPFPEYRKRRTQIKPDQVKRWNATSRLFLSEQEKWILVNIPYYASTSLAFFMNVPEIPDWRNIGPDKSEAREPSGVGGKATCEGRWERNERASLCQQTSDDPL